MAKAMFGAREFRTGPTSSSPAMGKLISALPVRMKTLLSVFDAPIPKERQPNLVDAARKAIADNGRSRLAPNAVGAAVSRLIFASPEFQFC